MVGNIIEVVKVKRQKVEACMTCPLCNKLFRDATTISLCLHTFCRKCIYEKLSDEEMDSCPVCNIDLGCLPMEKLRPDHNLQDIRSQIFPFKRRKIKAPEVPSISLPTKRKERSLSSLVVSAPKVSSNTGFTGKRTKTATKKTTAALRGCSFMLGESLKTEATSSEDNLDSSVAEPSKKHRPSEDTQNNVELTEGKVDLWTPLNCLVEAANRTKSSKSNSQVTPHAKLESLTTPYNKLDMSETATKSEPHATLQSESQMPKTKIKDNGHKTEFGDDKGGNSCLTGPVKRRRLRKKRAAVSQMLDASGSRCNRKVNPIWFSLVASEDQKGDVTLPQISACYLRIKDGTVPVSFIHKYLVKKLNLASETEVEIMCRGQPVLPSLQLHNLVDLWFQTTSSTTNKLPASVGSSAKDFVMALSYCRKALSN